MATVLNMATQPKSILHAQIIFQKDLVLLIGRSSIKTTFYNLDSLHSVFFLSYILSILAVGFMLMDDNNIYCTYNECGVFLDKQLN